MTLETRELRDRVYGLLGGCCEGCGERNYDVLTIHHIHGDGGEERRLTKRSGRAKYRYYLTHGIPRSGPYAVELRCRNCNEGLNPEYIYQEQSEGMDGMPSGFSKKQISPSVKEDTITYLKKVAGERNFTMGEAIDLVVQEHAHDRDLVSAVRAIRAQLDQVVEWQVKMETLLLPGSTGMADTRIGGHTEVSVDPYETIRSGPPAVLPQSGTRPPSPPRTFWDRIVDAYLGDSA